MCHNASDSDFSRSQSPSDVLWQVQTAAERSLCVCRGAENVASQDLQEFGVLHKQETESWRSRWLLPSTDVISPEGLNTPDLIARLTSARTRERHCKTQRGVIKHGNNNPADDSQTRTWVILQLWYQWGRCSHSPAGYGPALSYIGQN